MTEETPAILGPSPSQKIQAAFTFSDRGITARTARKLVRRIQETPELNEYFLAFLEGPEAEAARARYNQNPVDVETFLGDKTTTTRTPLQKKVRENADLTALIREIRTVQEASDQELGKTGDLEKVIHNVQGVKDMVNRLFALAVTHPTTPETVRVTEQELSQGA